VSAYQGRPGLVFVANAKKAVGIRTNATLYLGEELRLENRI
jgi:hypothetical protein